MTPGMPVPVGGILRPCHPAYSVVLTVAIRVYCHGGCVGESIGGLERPELVTVTYLHANKLGSVYRAGTIPISGNSQYHLEVVRVLIEVGDDGAREPDVRGIGVAIGIAQRQSVPVRIPRI